MFLCNTNLSISDIFAFFAVLHGTVRKSHSTRRRRPPQIAIHFPRFSVRQRRAARTKIVQNGAGAKQTFCGKKVFFAAPLYKRIILCYTMTA